MGADSYHFYSAVRPLGGPDPAAAAHPGDVEVLVDLPAKAAVRAA